MTRKDLLKIAFIASETGLTFDQFKEGLKDWKLKPIKAEGQVVGAFMNKNSEIHFSVLKDWRGKWFTRQIIKEFLLPVFRVYGFLITRADNEFGRNLVKRFGFNHVSGNIYRMESLKWV